MSLSASDMSALAARAPGKMLYAFHPQLRDGDRVALYQATDADESEASAVTIIRDGLRPFVAPAISLKKSDGNCFIEAISAPGNQSRYTYLLLREVAAFDRTTGQIELMPAPGNLVGMTSHDRYEVDLMPGLYYVSARNDTGGTALLLGPYAHHLEALTMVGRASAYLVDRSPDATWLHYGTARRSDPAESAPVGKLNSLVLSSLEQAALMLSTDHLEQDEHERPSCRP